MSVQPPENGQVPTGNPEDNNGNPDPNQNPGHPAWKEILDVLPDSLHSIVTPTLEKWDKGVQEKFTQFHQTYDPYKEIVEQKVPVDRIKQGLMVAQMIESDPAALVQQLVDHFKLEQFMAADDDDDDDDDIPLELEGVDVEALKKHPAFKELFKQQEQMAQYYEQQRQAQEQNESQKMMQDLLSDLHEKHGEFNDLFVTSLLAAGVEPEDAVKQFKDTINQALQAHQGTQPPPVQPPVVMGSSGNTGAGVPNQDVKLGRLTNSQTVDMVTQILQQAAAENPNN